MNNAEWSRLSVLLFHACKHELAKAREQDDIVNPIAMGHTMNAVMLSLLGDVAKAMAVPEKRDLDNDC